jgi:hypothetical protein
MVRSPILRLVLLSLRFTHPPQPPSSLASDEEEDGEGAGAEEAPSLVTGVAVVVATGAEVAVASCASAKRIRWVDGREIVQASKTARRKREREGNL